MRAPSHGADTRLHKVKRPGGVFWFDLRLFLEDRDGTWLRGPVGSPWGAPHDEGVLPVPVVVLLAPGRPWVAWWADADLALRTAEDRAEALRRRTEPWQARGWQMLAG